MKRREGVHRTHLNEVQQLVSVARRRRMKYWKWSVKSMKRIERECRAVEKHTEDRVDVALSPSARK